MLKDPLFYLEQIYIDSNREQLGSLLLKSLFIPKNYADICLIHKL